MAVGNHKTITWYSISNGKIRHKTRKEDGGRETFYDYIEGNLTSVTHEKDSYKGKPADKFMFKFEPDNHSYVEILSVSEISSAARGLLASLSTIPEEAIRQIRITPYTTLKHYDDEMVEFTNVDVMYRNNSGAEWIRLADLKETSALYKKIFARMPDKDGDRHAYLIRMMNSVVTRLNELPEFDPETGEITESAPGKSPEADVLYDEPGDDLPF